jgi:hypothetical protein
VFLIREAAVTVENTSTGLSLACMECNWVEQLAVGTSPKGAKRIAEAHYQDTHVPA